MIAPLSRHLHRAASELRAMQEAGVEIGPHAASYTRLTELGDERMPQKRKVSKSTVENLLGRPVNSFVYPDDAWNEHCETTVRAPSTTQTGWAIRDNNPFRLQRLTAFNEDTGSLFARKLAFARHDVRRAELAGYWRRRLAAKRTGQP